MTRQAKLPVLTEAPPGTIDRIHPHPRGILALTLLLAFGPMWARPGAATAESAARCAGDCDGSGEVMIHEVLTMVNVGLGTRAPSGCAGGDANGDGSVTIAEVVTAVNVGLGGCVDGRAVFVPPPPTPTPIPICDPLPRDDCSSAAESSLVVRTNVKMVWKFKDAVATDELGDPSRGDTQYGLCVYDERGGVPVLAAHTAVGPGGNCPPDSQPCWQRKRRKILYHDIGHRREGVEKIVLKDSRILFKVTGLRQLPRPVSPAELFDQDSRVIAQVVNSDGFCWEAIYEPDNVARNLPHVYRAQIP